MTIGHSLSLTVRFRDHFSGRPVPQELPVRLADSYLRPARRQDGNGQRQADGTYRFLGVPAGVQRVLWREPFQRSQAGWTRWDAGDPEVILPLADPAQVVEYELWPTQSAEVAPGSTGVRGKMQGTNAAGLEIMISLQGQPPDRVTRTDQAGEFLFLPPGALPVDPTGRVPLVIVARGPGGLPRTITSCSFQPTSAGASSAGPDFTILPQTVARVIFRMA